MNIPALSLTCTLRQGHLKKAQMRVCQQGISVSVIFLFEKTFTSSSWNFAQYCKSVPDRVGCLLFIVLILEV